jgi:hypothetical protein
MRLDLPLPDTPVMQVSKPTGISAVAFFRLCARAPTTETEDLPLGFLFAGTGSRFMPER